MNMLWSSLEDPREGLLGGAVYPPGAIIGSALLFLSCLLENGLVFAMLQEGPSAMLSSDPEDPGGWVRPRAEGMCCLGSSCAGEGERVWWAPGSGSSVAASRPFITVLAEDVL